MELVSDTYDDYEQEYEFLSRTMDLSSDELMETNKELRKRNEELDRFVYSTSHDLRAPLTSILGLLQVIELTEDPQEIEKFHNQIKKSTLQLDKFIQDIVEYTRNRKQDINYEKINLKELVNGCVEKLDFMDNGGSIDKKICVDQKVDFFSDVKRIDIIFSNLISNAIKYLDNSKSNPFVKISCDCSNGQANIQVKDNGIGISEAHLPSIFNMFYRASSGSKGSGIGLYIVKEIVEKLSGTISIDSTLGEGTTFDIVIPNNVPVKD